MRVLAAVDKFRGTATAAQVAAAIGHACWDLGHECIETPIGDGGEGTLDVLGGANRTTRVTNPLGKPVDAASCCGPRVALGLWRPGIRNTYFGMHPGFLCLETSCVVARSIAQSTV